MVQKAKFRDFETGDFIKITWMEKLWQSKVHRRRYCIVKVRKKDERFIRAKIIFTPNERKSFAMQKLKDTKEIKIMTDDAKTRNNKDLRLMFIPHPHNYSKLQKLTKAEAMLYMI